MMTPRFSDAFSFASELHRDQLRKGSSIPYISHLLAVTALVLENGGDEDQAIAALLHDAVEDQGGVATGRAILERFGVSVAQIVMACTDAAAETGKVKPPWRVRKQAFIDRLPQLPPRAALVLTCDKIHNLTCTIADVEAFGLAALDRFVEPEGLCWYYREVGRTIDQYAAIAPVRRLQAIADEFSILVDHLAQTEARE